MASISFDHQPRTRLVAGAGAIARAGDLARQAGITATLLVTDPGVRRAGHADRAAAALHQAGVSVTWFDEVRENPTTDDVARCAERARGASIDGLVAVGGGSAIDTAKGCNFLLTNGGAMRDYWGWAKATRPMLPLIAAPTTAGTGSEVQSYALIADPVSRRKMACGDPQAAPRVAILDVELTLTAPSRVTALAGMDAIAHALESAVTRNRGPVSAAYARQAFGMLAAALPHVIEQPEDRAAREQTLIGASLAGLAIEHSMLGAAHACANPLTMHCHVPHGAAVGVMLPHVIRHNAAAPGAAAIYRQLARDLVAVSAATAVGDDHATPEHLAQWVEALLARFGLNHSLAEHGVTVEAVPALAGAATEEWTGKFNPRALTAEDFIALYHAALSGSRVRQA